MRSKDPRPFMIEPTNTGSSVDPHETWKSDAQEHEASSHREAASKYYKGFGKSKKGAPNIKTYDLNGGVRYHNPKGYRNLHDKQSRG